MASFEELDAVIKNDEVAFGQLRQPSERGDSYILLPPLEVSWDSHPISETVDLTTVTITACTGSISLRENTVVAVSPKHPHDFGNVKRWKHLPFYNDWQLYVRYKTKFLLVANKQWLMQAKVLMRAVLKPTWEAPHPPTLVESRVPGPDFAVTRRGYLPYQHPALTRTVAGLATLKEHLVQVE